MSKELLERIDDLETERFELKQEICFLEENLESLDTAYTKACNLIYDCKVRIRQAVNHKASSKELMELLLELQSFEGKEKINDEEKE